MQETRSDRKLTFGQKVKGLFSGRRRSLWIALVLIVAGIGLWGFFASRSRTTAGNQNQMLRLARVSRGPIEVTVTGTGTVKPGRRWELSTRAAGDVKRVLVEAGQAVKAGQPLVELDADDASLKVENAKLELEQARSTLSDLENDLALLTVRSDSEGTLTGLSVKEGQSVPENYLIGTITSSKMEVRAYFNASQVKNIKVGQEARVFFPDLLWDMTGVVKHVSEAGKADGRGAVLYPVTVEIENKGALVPGLLATVEVNTPAGVMKAPDSTKETSYVTKEVRTKVSGTVKRILVADGDRVKSGQVLVELENEALKKQVESQRLKVSQAETQLSSAQDELASRTITAPADATVLDVKVREGDRIGAGAVVAILGDLSSMEVTVPVDEIDAGKVKVGQQATITSDAVPGKQFQGEVSGISLEGKVSGGVATFDTRVSVQGQTELLSGMTCDVRISIASKDDALILPIEALQSRGNEYMVWVVSNVSTSGEGQSQSRRYPSATVDRSILSEAKPVTVQVGLMNSTYAEILAGLKEGDTVVVFSQNSGQSGGTGQRFGPGLGNPGVIRMMPR
ncbi:MAG TPA: efflux RND transporter periplasmic adaptor subunit [Firmicutes bacterium]|nr:efflux RND transporter periplasmic adaptor subunit [Candidatus Fermentithermobacillaceae bacterium]